MHSCAGYVDDGVEKAQMHRIKCWLNKLTEFGLLFVSSCRAAANFRSCLLATGACE